MEHSNDSYAEVYLRKSRTGSHNICRKHRSHAEWFSTRFSTVHHQIESAVTFNRSHTIPRAHVSMSRRERKKQFAYRAYFPGCSSYLAVQCVPLSCIKLSIRCASLRHRHWELETTTDRIAAEERDRQGDATKHVRTIGPTKRVCEHEEACVTRVLPLPPVAS